MCSTPPGDGRNEAPAKTLSTCDRSIRGADLFLWVDESIAQPLMVPFVVAVCRKLIDCSAKRVHAKEDHAIQTGLPDRADEPLRVGVGLRRRKHLMVPIRRDFFRSRIPSIH